MRNPTKIRYLVVKRQKGGVLFYWQPSRSLRAAGFEPRRLAERSNDIADAVREAEDLNRRLDAWRSGAAPVTAGPGTLPDLIRRYREDVRFTELRARTQKNYGYWLRDIEAWSARAGHPPASTITRKDVKALARSMAAKPESAKYMIKVLRLLFAFAIDEGELQTNPAVDMRMKSNAPRRQVWTDEQVAALIETAAVQGRSSIGLAVALAFNTGQRRGDVLRMGWHQFDGSGIRVKQSKTGVLLDVPCTRQLLDVLAATPRTGTVMTINEKTGRPYKDQVFTDDFREIARAAGIPDDLQYRDLRRSAVVRLAEAGCSVPEVAAISGHSVESTQKIMEVYLPRTSVMGRHAIAKLEDYRRTQQERKLEG